MAIKDSGKLTMSDIALEVGESKPYKLSSSKFRELANKPNGEIKFSDFYGKSSTRKFRLTYEGQSPIVFECKNESELNKDNLIGVEYLSGVNKVINHAFGGYGQIKKVILHPNTKILGETAFSLCGGLIEINTENIEVIEKGALGLTGISYLNLSKVKRIDTEGIEHCYGLKSITFKDLEVLDNYAFYMDTSLTSLSPLPKIKRIGSKVFYKIILKELEIVETCDITNCEDWGLPTDCIVYNIGKTKKLNLFEKKWVNI